MKQLFMCHVNEHANSAILGYESLEGWTGKMAQRVNTLSAKPDSLDSIPGIHIVEREHRFHRFIL